MLPREHEAEAAEHLALARPRPRCERSLSRTRVGQRPRRTAIGAEDRLESMSESASLYRRHRPQSFSEVVGQEHVVRTLSNAVDQDRVHHAYLFVGSRGTGKTSMAKILARSLNCVNGPTLDALRRVRVVPTIAAGTSLDVIEMDAASNRSVDDVRELRERVGYAPGRGPLEGLHPRRGPHAHQGGLERLPEDARGAAAEHRLRPRHDRAAEGDGDDRRPLPALRLPAPLAGADRRGDPPRRRQPRGSRSRTAPSP